MSNQLGNLIVQLTQKEFQVCNRIVQLKNEIMAKELQVAQSIKGQRVALDKAIKEAMAEDPEWEDFVKELESLKVSKSILTHARKQIDNFSSIIMNETHPTVRDELMKQLAQVLKEAIALVN